MQRPTIPMLTCVLVACLLAIGCGADNADAATSESAAALASQSDAASATSDESDVTNDTGDIDGGTDAQVPYTGARGSCAAKSEDDHGSSGRHDPGRGDGDHMNAGTQPQQAASDSPD
jgi:hypothetical protein